MAERKTALRRRLTTALQWGNTRTGRQLADDLVDVLYDTHRAALVLLIEATERTAVHHSLTAERFNTPSRLS
jgi:hypothetical protein